MESFDTTPAAPQKRGTAYTHQVQTWNVQQCGEKRYFNCTPGCSWDTACPNAGFGETENTCEPPEQRTSAEDDGSRGLSRGYPMTIRPDGFVRCHRASGPGGSIPPA
ncbi:MAG TPA: hypothetical protein VHG08_15285, partial [Longimicrobium sp.]|nr:hypothetical protein [Longimicrobium sp.]